MIQTLEAVGLVFICSILTWAAIILLIASYEPDEEKTITDYVRMRFAALALLIVSTGGYALLANL